VRLNSAPSLLLVQDDEAGPATPDGKKMSALNFSTAYCALRPALHVRR
jgi:hypothetical protein